MGLLFHYLRRYIDKKLTTVEDEDKKRRLARIRRTQIDDEVYHAIGRTLFWIYRFIITTDHNGELDEAFQALQAAEAKKKELDREIIAENSLE